MFARISIRGIFARQYQTNANDNEKSNLHFYHCTDSSRL